MNRFELECRVDVRGFRKIRSLMGNVDPLSRRECRKKANALLAKHGRPTQPVPRPGDAVRDMAGNDWAIMIVYTILKTLGANRPVDAVPMSRDDAEEIGIRAQPMQAVYHRARSAGLSHSDAMCAVDAYDLPAREMARSGGRLVAQRAPLFSLAEAAKAIVASR